MTESLKRISEAAMNLLSTAEKRSSVAEETLKLLITRKKHSILKEKLSLTFNIFLIL